jgi:hypothetical protein
MKKKGLIIALALVLVVIIAAFATLIIKHNNNDVEPGDKVISVTIVNADKTQKLFKISTDAENLGDALLQRNLVTEEEHKTGFYTYINGVRADYTLDGAWWCFTKGGEEVMKGANDLAIADGDSFEITHTPA